MKPIYLFKLPLPIETCNTPEALDAFARQFRTTVNGEADNFLNTDMNKDWANDETSDYDILQSKFSNGVAYAESTGDRLESVSAITFSITKDGTWRPTTNDPIKVHWSKGTSSVSGSYGCGAGGEISPPVIISDTRNEAGRNIFDLPGNASMWWLRGERLYIEIRHGLNTENYLAMVSEQKYFHQTPKKNSLILSRYLDRADLRHGIYNGGRLRSDESLYELPNRRINVVFYADPCEGTFNGVTQGVG